MPLGYIFYPSHCFYSGYIHIQKPFQVNIPRHNNIVCRRLGLGFNRKFQILAIHLSCTQHHTRIRGIHAHRPFFIRNCEGNYGGARASLCLRRQVHLQQRNVLPYLHFRPAYVVGNLEWTGLSPSGIWIRPWEGHNPLLYPRTSSASFIFSGHCAKLRQLWLKYPAWVNCGTDRTFPLTLIPPLGRPLSLQISPSGNPQMWKWMKLLFGASTWLRMQSYHFWWFFSVCRGNTDRLVKASSLKSDRPKFESSAIIYLLEGHRASYLLAL